MGKFLINTSDRQEPTIEEYDEGELKDELRDEIVDELKEEWVQDVQCAADDHEMELDQQIADIEDKLNEAQSALSRALDAVGSFVGETNFRVEDHI